jgi:hypothetical protein
MDPELQAIADDIVDVLAQRPAELVRRLKPQYRRQHPGCPAGLGFCYAAAEALYHLGGGKAAGLTPYVARLADGTHWWLEDAASNVYDPTADQFSDPGAIYPLGVGKGFLTKAPSKTAQLIIDEVVEE